MSDQLDPSLTLHQGYKFEPSLDAYPLVSVAIPTYNHEAYLAECLESVLADDYPRVEIIVSDDASTDSTLTLAKHFRDRFPHKIKIIAHQKNRGHIANYRSLAQHCQGEYVCWFAGDDVFLPGKIALQVKLMQANPKAALCYHDAEVFCTNNTFKPYLYYNQYYGQPIYTGDIFNKLLVDRCFVCSPAIMVRQNMMPNYLYADDTGYSADWYFCIEMASRGEAIYCDKPLIRYRQHPASLTRIAGISSERVGPVLEKTFASYHVASKVKQQALASYYIQYILCHLLHGNLLEGGRFIFQWLEHLLQHPKTIVISFAHAYTLIKRKIWRKLLL